MTDNGQFTVFEILVCPIKVLHSCRNCDGNNVFEEVKNRLKMEHIHLNGKRKLEAKQQQHTTNSIRF